MAQRTLRNRTPTGRAPAERVYKSQPRLRQKRLLAPDTPLSSVVSPVPATLPLRRQQTLTQIVDLDLVDKEELRERGWDSGAQESHQKWEEQISKKDRKESTPATAKKRKRQSTLTQIDFFNACQEISSDEVSGLQQLDYTADDMAGVQVHGVEISPPLTHKKRRRHIAFDPKRTSISPPAICLPRSGSNVVEQNSATSRSARAAKPAVEEPKSCRRKAKLEKAPTYTDRALSTPSRQRPRIRRLRSPARDQEQESRHSSERPREARPIRTLLPQTPRKPIILEIPSSQTPPATPLTVPRSTRHLSALSSPSHPPRSPLTPISARVLAARDATVLAVPLSLRRVTAGRFVPTQLEIMETAEENIENFVPANGSQANIPSPARARTTPPLKRPTLNAHSSSVSAPWSLPWAQPSSNAAFSEPSLHVPSSPPMTFISLEGVQPESPGRERPSGGIRSSQASTVDLGSSPPAPVPRTLVVSSQTQDQYAYIMDDRHESDDDDDEPIITLSRTVEQASALSCPVPPHHRLSEPIESQLWFDFDGDPSETQARLLGEVEPAASIRDSGDIIGATQLLDESLEEDYAL